MLHESWNGGCPDCGDEVTRRKFLASSAAGVAAVGAIGSALPLVGAEQQSLKQPRPKSETLVGQLYQSMTDEQKQKCAFKFDHPLRAEVDNNWHITKVRVGKDFTPEQQELILSIFNGLHSEEYAKQVLSQVEHDTRSKGVAGCSIAVFGEPGTGKFEFVLSGRHVTRRCDGDSVEGAAFGGPIFYGHAAEGFNEKPTHPGNVYWYQAKRANALFEALDGKQRKLALRTDPREEEGTDTVALSRGKRELAGMPVSEMTADQKKLARQVMADVLAPFRPEDAEESMKLIEAGGFDKLHFSYFSNMDIGNDGVWDVWQVEGPAMVWHFRGAPHVHTWVNIRDPRTV